jgi:protein-disulfide isomerase
MHRNLFKFLTLVLLLTALTIAQDQSAKPKENSVAGARTANTVQSSAALPSEETVNAFMQQMFGYDSNITWKISSIKASEAEGLAEVNLVLANPQGQQLATLYVTPDGKHALLGEVIPFGAKPFAPAAQKLKSGNGISRGPENAPVTIVEFSDLQCPHCKEAQPTIDKLLNEEPSVKFVFQQFPLPSHEWAAKAAAYADCVGRSNNAAFWKFVNSTYAAQSEITPANADDKLISIADAAGVKGSDIAACAAKPDIKTRIDNSVELGKSVGVNGTPTLFINGRKVANVNGTPYEILKGMVDYGAKTK